MMWGRCGDPRAPPAEGPAVVNLAAHAAARLERFVSPCASSRLSSASNRGGDGGVGDLGSPPLLLVAAVL